MIHLILFLEVLLCLLVILTNSQLSNEEILTKYIRQGLDAVTQDVLKSKDSKIWHAYKFNTGIRNREELIIKSIKSDDRFNVGQEVTEWQSLNVQDKTFAVGKMTAGFTVMAAKITQNQTFMFQSKLLMLNEHSTAYTMFKLWNMNKMKYDIYLIVATVSRKYDLHWFQITENLDLNRIWIWKLLKPVSHIKVFEIQQNLKLLLVNEKPVTYNTSSAEIYDVDLHDSIYKYWLLQTIKLNCSSKISAINKFANEIYLTIPQPLSNCVNIYKLSNKKFLLKEIINSKNVSIVTDFVIGERSFLAIGGLNSGIYELTKSGFKKQNIIDINFEEVTYYLPLHVKSYRDEIILLVQHHIDYTSHVAPYVKVLIFSKEAFYVHDEIPCSFLGLNVNGATCMADPERELGISGSAALNLGKMLAAVVPRNQVESGLFYFDWSLEQVDNPIARKVESIIKSRIQVEKLLQQQRKDVADIRNRLSHALNVNGDNEITGNWKVNTLVAPNIQSPNMQYNDPDEYSQNSESFSFESDFTVISDEIDSLQIKILQTRATDVTDDIVFDHLKINGKLNVQAGSNIENLYVDKVNGYNFNDLVEDCVRRSQKNFIPGTKIFKEADVDKITFAKLNNISAENIAYNTRNGVKIKGDVTFKNILLIHDNVQLSKDGKVNDIDIKNELVFMNSDATYANIHFENLQTDYLHYVKSINDINMEDVMHYKDIGQGGLNLEMDYLDLTNVNITTQHINDQEFNSFMSNLCLRNFKCKFPGSVHINGKMHVKGSIEINNLNNLQYPENYLISQNDGFTKITGKKVFLGNVSATEVVVTGLVDGVNPDEIITCTTAQTIPGNFTFTDLEITESFRVDGDIFIGPNLTKFIPNPTLEDTHTINSTALFSKLQVNGPVIVSNLFNGSSLTDLFQDIVYKDEEIVSINTDKKLTRKLTVHNNLNVDSKTINNINMENILTLDSTQSVSNNKINGKIVIENLEIKGLFNGDDINTKINDLIRLDADEIIDSEIIFENDDDDPDIAASELQIDKVNNMNVSDMITTIGDRKFEGVEFHSVKATNVQFLKDVNYDIECFDINEYAENRFSLTRDQTITGKIRVNNGSVENISTEQINDIDWNLVKTFMNISDILYEKFVTGFFKIGDLHVDNSINLDILNNENLNDLYETVYWVNKSNNLFVKTKFQGDITVENLNIKTLNGVDFHKFLKDIILKTEKDIKLKGYKYFQNGLTIFENLDVNKINSLAVEHIMLKSENQEIAGHVIVHGNVTIHQDFNVKDSVNDIPVNFISKHFKVEDGKYIIKGNISFENYVTIENMVVKGKANDINSEDYLNNVVSIYDDIIINGTTVFTKKCTVNKNIVADIIDGISLNKVMDEIVLVSSDDYVQGLVSFIENVQVQDTIELETDLDTNTLCGCSVQDWINKAIFITSGYLEGEIKFEEISILNNVKVDLLNDINMNDLITLHTNQTIQDTLNLGLVKSDNDIQVNHLINGYNLKEEYENTVMTNKDQELISHLIFLNHVTVTHNLKTSGLVNGKDLSRLVTTNTEQNLTASYFFNGKVTLDRNLTALGKVNDINITDWMRRTVTASGDDKQDIRDKWKVAGKLTFQDEITGDGLLGGMEVKQLANQVMRKQQDKYQIENVIQRGYRDICIDVQKLVEISKQKPFIFRHLKHHDELHFEHNISSIHYFKYHHRYYLIVSQENNCHSSLYEWIPDSFKFTAKMRTGVVEQFITVLDTDRVYLVTKSSKSMQCEDLGTNVWIFEDDTLTHIYALNHSLLLQKSKLPRTFYSLQNKTVTEYKLFYEDENAVVHTYRQWDIPTANYELSPFDFKLDVSGNKIKRFSNEQDGIKSDYEATAFIENVNVAKYYLPPTNVKEFLVFQIGNITKLTAVAIWEEAVVQTLTDEIRIYTDYDNGKLYNKISTIRPSNLNVLQFGKHDETFLAFLENYKSIKLYEYTGLMGFKLRSTTDITATKMISISLPIKSFQSKRKFLVLVNKNILTIVQAIMYGDRPIESFHCEP